MDTGHDYNIVANRLRIPINPNQHFGILSNPDRVWGLVSNIQYSILYTEFLWKRFPNHAFISIHGNPDLTIRNSLYRKYWQFIVSWHYQFPNPLPIPEWFLYHLAINPTTRERRYA